MLAIPAKREASEPIAGSLPVAIFYSLFVDYYVSSLTGAVKE